MTKAVRERMSGGPAGGVYPEYGGVAIVSDRLPGLDVGITAVDVHVPGFQSARHDELVHRAIENYVIEVMTAQAREEERMQRIGSGREPAYILSPPLLTGSYPATVLEVGQFSRSRNEQKTMYRRGG